MIEIESREVIDGDYFENEVEMLVSGVWKVRKILGRLVQKNQECNCVCTLQKYRSPQS